MQAKFLEVFENEPEVVIAPDSCPLDSFGGRIVVHYFSLNLDTAKRDYAPYAQINVSFSGKFSDAEITEWAEAFRLAADFIEMQPKPWHNVATGEAMHQVSARISEIMAARLPAPAV